VLRLAKTSKCHHGRQDRRPKHLILLGLGEGRPANVAQSIKCHVSEIVALVSNQTLRGVKRRAYISKRPTRPCQPILMLANPASPHLMSASYLSRVRLSRLFTGSRRFRSRFCACGTRSRAGIIESIQSHACAGMGERCKVITSARCLFLRNRHQRITIAHHCFLPSRRQSNRQN